MSKGRDKEKSAKSGKKSALRTLKEKRADKVAKRADKNKSSISGLFAK